MADYIAWLIEMDESGPVYFQMVDDDDWTKDHDKALHFARKRDAEKVIAYYGWTRAKAIEHMWPEHSEGGAERYQQRLHGLLQNAAARINAPAFPVPTDSIERAQMKRHRKDFP